MSTYVLSKFSDLVTEGVRTDKGFKDCHVNAVARELQSYIGQQVSGTQVYNHLRKWRTKWVKICRLKDLSGANWDEDLCMITLDPKHYHGHVKDHSKDAEFLNVPIVNYQYMQTIFGCGVATGRFAMGSNEALDQPAAEPETIDVDSNEAPPATKEDTAALKDKDKSDDKKKRKRMLNQDDVALMTGFTDAIWGLNAALSEGNHSEAAPGIYEAVMGCPNFSRSDLMTCLNYLMDHKAPAMVFVEMSPSDKEQWINTHLAKVRGQMAFQ